jgi:hypothetical protein
MKKLAIIFLKKHISCIAIDKLLIGIFFMMLTLNKEPLKRFFFPNHVFRFAVAIANQAAREKEAAILAGKYGTCSNCKTTSDCRRCTGQ